MEQSVPVEREIKLAVEDLADVEARLRSLEGAAFQGVESETNHVLDTAGRALAQCLQRLRLRLVEGQTGVRVTWKGPARGDPTIKAREEQEYHADEAATCAAVFDRLGYKPVLTYKKERATWLWNGLSITLDRLVFGTFVEIEVQGGVAAEDEGRLLRDCLSQLGLEEAKTVDASYAQLQEQWNQHHS